MSSDSNATGKKQLAKNKEKEDDSDLTFSSIDQAITFAMSRGFDPLSKSPTLAQFFFSEHMELIPLDEGGYVLEVRQ